MRTRIVAVTSATALTDPRVLKEADALAAAGYEVTVLAWDRAGEAARAFAERSPTTERLNQLNFIAILRGDRESALDTARRAQTLEGGKAHGFMFRTLWFLGDWDGAEACFRKVSERWPDDGPSEHYLEDIASKRLHPPPEGWDGVYEMKTK